MDIISDLHIHSKFSRACSKNLVIKNLEKYGKIKGVNLIGTGDFTHPEWIKEIKSELTEVDNSGIFQTKTGFKFMLTSEVSLIYTHHGKGRRVHQVLFAPNLEVVEQITDYLLKHGRIDYDGRPIFKIPSPEFVENMMQIDKKIEVIPAHIWTPWFGMLGANSGYNSIKECFDDQIKNVHAIETGLSSDPGMNRRLSELDNIQLLSFSDSHSFWPWRLGREATLFSMKKLTYDNILKAVRTGEGLKETIEVDPGFGKYHFTGHRNCGVNLSPKEAIKLRNICPVCRKQLTIGVEQRVDELADREEPKNAPLFKKMIPVSELLSLHYKAGIATKKIWEKFNALSEGRSELDILLNMEKEKIAAITDNEFAEIIMKNRAGGIEVVPGYDGVYGIPIVGDKNDIPKKEIIKPKQIQKELGT
jgi:uncharacterized protein (TIGR00375 family)